MGTDKHRLRNCEAIGADKHLPNFILAPYRILTQSATAQLYYAAIRHANIANAIVHFWAPTN